MIYRDEVHGISGKVEELLNDQFKKWKLMHTNYCALKDVKVKSLSIDGFHVKVQFNPERIRSSAAKTDAASLQARSCFFCNRPEEQNCVEFNDSFEILANPYPVSDRHLTIPLKCHEEQKILPYYEDMLRLANTLSDYVIFYNGPKCGASAPDHMHFQGINRHSLPIEEHYKNAEKEVVCQIGSTTLYALEHFMASVFVLTARSVEEASDVFQLLYRQLKVKEGNTEPMMNVVTWMEEYDYWVTCIFPRKELRPSCFYAEGEANLLISPATVEMSGLFITPLEKDFEKVTAEDLKTILREVSLSEEAKNEVVRKVKQSIL